MKVYEKEAMLKLYMNYLMKMIILYTPNWLVIMNIHISQIELS